MSALPQIKIIFDRRKTATATTKGSVEIEVYYNREHVRLSTGVSVNKTQWRKIREDIALSLPKEKQKSYREITKQTHTRFYNDLLELKDVQY